MQVEQAFRSLSAKLEVFPLLSNWPRRSSAAWTPCRQGKQHIPQQGLHIGRVLIIVLKYLARFHRLVIQCGLVFEGCGSRKEGARREEGIGWAQTPRFINPPSFWSHLPVSLVLQQCCAPLRTDQPGSSSTPSQTTLRLQEVVTAWAVIVTFNRAMLMNSGLNNSSSFYTWYKRETWRTEISSAPVSAPVSHTNTQEGSRLLISKWDQF